MIFELGEELFIVLYILYRFMDSCKKTIYENGSSKVVGQGSICRMKFFDEGRNP